MKKEKYQHMAFSFLSQHYNSDIIGLKLGENLVVVVSGMNLVQDVLTKEEFEGRPDNFFIRLRSMGTRKGVTCTDGYLWHDQRAFVLRHLRNLGYGKQNMENILHDELIQLRKQLGTSNNQKIRIGPQFAKAVLNTMWTLVGGSRLSSSKFYLDKMLVLLEKRTRLFDISGGLLNHFPWLRFLVPSKTGYKLIMDINNDLKTLFQEVIAEHLSTYDSVETRDLIDAYLHQMKSTEKKNNIFYTDDQLIMVCLDLFIAGSQTTSNTLDFAILLMVLHQDIQRKVQKEIWSVIGTERLPSINDRYKMPYVDAVICEVLRLCQVTPVAGPRRALKDTELGGYYIPKNTSILINLHSVNNDKQHWSDPEAFRPDRFLNGDGTLRSDDHLIAFGLGRRRCLGETLARSCIFLFFTGILQHYHILPVNDENPDITPVPGMTMAPQPYHANFVPAEVFIDKSDLLPQ
ncbi:hypothetical protein R5R35_006860 [Gryllus longicercus]|uniref:Cytochrome P450 n=1 Tax=Gryllus longicercus TaxID=2509291 RepID=A0AAN9VN15_9ORTH